MRAFADEVSVDQGVTILERENDRLKRIVAEKELELDISRKVRRL